MGSVPWHRRIRCLPLRRPARPGFTGAECDTYRTKDGVWVISHDSHTYRMMDQHAFVEKKTYDELLTYNTDNGVNIDQYPN